MSHEVSPVGVVDGIQDRTASEGRPVGRPGGTKIKMSGATFTGAERSGRHNVGRSERAGWRPGAAVAR